MPRAQRRTAGRQASEKFPSICITASLAPLLSGGPPRGSSARRRRPEREALRIAAEINAQLGHRSADDVFVFADDRGRTTPAVFGPSRVCPEIVIGHRESLPLGDQVPGRLRRQHHAHRVDPDLFVRHLRSLQVSPTATRIPAKNRCAEKGIRFILERPASPFTASQRNNGSFRLILRSRFAARTVPARPRRCQAGICVRQSQRIGILRHVTVWALPIFLTLAKTACARRTAARCVEDLDLDGGWWHVRSKPDLDWWVKTRRDRSVPLVPEFVDVLRRLLGGRNGGPVFLRERFGGYSPHTPPLSYVGLSKLVAPRHCRAGSSQQTLSRSDRARIARAVRRSGGRPPDCAAASVSGSERCHRFSAMLTCPKCFRHTFATLLQEANVDPLIRQLTLGHAPAGNGMATLGMTSLYTHTSPALQHREIVRAMQLRPETLTPGRRANELTVQVGCL